MRELIESGMNTKSPSSLSVPSPPVQPSEVHIQPPPPHNQPAQASPAQHLPDQPPLTRHPSARPRPPPEQPPVQPIAAQPAPPDQPTPVQQQSVQQQPVQPPPNHQQQGDGDPFIFLLAGRSLPPLPPPRPGQAEGLDGREAIDRLLLFPIASRSQQTIQGSVGYGIQ